jgi:apolipoprotein N-acyltransferase
MAKNKHFKYLLLSLTAIALLSHGWYQIGFFPLTIFGFIPVFFLEHYIRTEQENRKLWLFIYGFLTFFGWNLATIWWIWNATAGGAIAAYFINSLPMVLPLILYSNLNALNGKLNHWFFIAAWISLEMLQFYWDFAFPWLILGNAFAFWPNLAQWFEFTGVLGGSLYILWFGFAAFKWLLHYKEWPAFTQRKKIFNLLFFGLFAPAFLSYYLLNQHKKQNALFNRSANFVVVQPNIDPYGEKFGDLSPLQQLNRMLDLAKQKITAKTHCIVLPETALQGGLKENDLENEELISTIRVFLKQYPHVSILCGADSYKIYDKKEKPSATAREAYNGTVTYDAFNTAFFIEHERPVDIYHKNKLVPGVEQMPYPALFKFLEKFAIELGGTSGSLGKNGSSKIFTSQHQINFAPIICYESAFPAFTASYVNKKADVLVIITNDGWWGNTPGYKQHLAFASLRAIENRRAVIRCANTGISAAIDETGEIINKTQWWQPEVFEASVLLTNKLTFYTSYSDLIGWFMVAFFVFKLPKLFRKPGLM